MLRASVIMSNNTGTLGRAYIYGPALQWARRISPVLPPRPISFHQTKGPRSTYTGFLVAGVQPDKPVHLAIRFARPPQPVGILASPSQVITADEKPAFADSDCVIQ